jgi:putative endonuclease
MKMWVVYLIECSDNKKSIYCGITNDLEKRIKTHNSGKGSKFTRVRLPVKLLYYENSINRSEASKREYQIKKMTREEKVNLFYKKNI